MKKMKKTFCIVLSVVLVVASVAAFMFIPRKGTISGGKCFMIMLSAV